MRSSRSSGSCVGRPGRLLLGSSQLGTTEVAAHHSECDTGNPSDQFGDQATTISRQIIGNG